MIYDPGVSELPIDKKHKKCYKKYSCEKTLKETVPSL